MMTRNPPIPNATSSPAPTKYSMYSMVINAKPTVTTMIPPERNLDPAYPVLHSLDRVHPLFQTVGIGFQRRHHVALDHRDAFTNLELADPSRVPSAAAP